MVSGAVADPAPREKPHCRHQQLIQYRQNQHGPGPPIFPLTSARKHSFPAAGDPAMQVPGNTLPALLILAIATAQPALANGGMFRGSGLKPGEVYDGRMLTVDELDACLGVEDDIRDLDSDIEQAEMLRSIEEQRYRSLDYRISVEKQTLDTSDARAVEHYNDLLDEHRKLTDAYNAGVASFNARLDQQSAAVDRFNGDCAAFGYYESDLLKARSLREKRLGAEIEAQKQAAAKIEQR
jgi:hypothetical protein